MGMEEEELGGMGCKERIIQVGSQLLIHPLTFS